MTLVDTYLAGLREALPAEQLNALKHAHGASAADLQRLTERYPLAPASLLELLGRIDGTHCRDYPEGRVMVLVLGSDVFEYPYYLSSVDQILEERDTYTRSIAQIYAGYLDEVPELVGPGIDMTLGMHERLGFSHCMNNGGSSKLYIDFNPVTGGNVGQVVRYLHDPDSYEVIAPDFDHYLQQLIDDQYAFVFEDEDD